MEDKTFALLEKLHIELLDTKKQLNDAQDISNQRFDKIEGQFSVMSGQFSVMSGQFSVMAGKLNVVEGNLNVMEGKLNVMEGKFSVMAGQLTVMAGQLTVMEQGHGMKLDAALDGYKLVFEKLQEHDLRFDSLEEKLQAQELEVRVIKGSKSVAG